MKWTAPILSRQRRLEQMDWHLWFAWYPVRIDDAWFWLTRVKRRVFYAQGWRVNKYADLDWRRP
jgi:hypothetical protein